MVVIVVPNNADLIQWPTDLRRQVGLGNFVLFVGAGVSMSSVNVSGARPPSWSSLLQSLLERLIESTGEASIAHTIAERMINEGRYLDAADYISHHFRVSGNSNEFDRAIDDLCNGPRGDRFAPSELHDRLLDLQPRIIVTTNFDSILEAAGGVGFTQVGFAAGEIDNFVRQQEPVIIKLHGTCGTSGQIIFTEREYAMFPSEGKLAIQVLKSLLMTRMALFVGYSANDPDLKEILRDIFAGRSARPGHVMILEEPVDPSRIELMRECYGITLKTIPEGQFHLIPPSLKDLSSSLADL